MSFLSNFLIKNITKKIKKIIVIILITVIIIIIIIIITLLNNNRKIIRKNNYLCFPHSPTLLTLIQIDTVNAQDELLSESGSAIYAQ